VCVCVFVGVFVGVSGGYLCNMATILFCTHTLQANQDGPHSSTHITTLFSTILPGQHRVGTITMLADQYRSVTARNFLDHHHRSHRAAPVRAEHPAQPSPGPPSPGRHGLAPDHDHPIIQGPPGFGRNYRLTLSVLQTVHNSRGESRLGLPEIPELGDWMRLEELSRLDEVD
jgi:hypothetical protein